MTRKRFLKEHWYMLHDAQFENSTLALALLEKWDPARELPPGGYLRGTS